MTLLYAAAGTYQVHWRIRGGAAGAPPPPNRIHFFRFHIRFHRKVYASEVGAPPMGNPGSATVSVMCICTHNFIDFTQPLPVTIVYL